MDSASDDFMVVQQKNGDFSLFAHKTQSHTLTSSLPPNGGITCGCSGDLRGRYQGCDQREFPTFSIYLEIQAKSQVR